MFGMPSSLLVKSVVRGYHVYKELWEPKVCKKFIILHKQGNKHDGHRGVRAGPAGPVAAGPIFRRKIY